MYIKDKRKGETFVSPFYLRRPDSNRRPLGYEPNELPTAPLRDVISLLRVQRYGFLLNYQMFSEYFFCAKRKICCNMLIDSTLNHC